MKSTVKFQYAARVFLNDVHIFLGSTFILIDHLVAKYKRWRLLNRKEGEKYISCSREANINQTILFSNKARSCEITFCFQMYALCLVRCTFNCDKHPLKWISFPYNYGRIIHNILSSPGSICVSHAYFMSHFIPRVSFKQCSIQCFGM